MLRGLSELYEWRQEPAVLDEIRRIVKNLALPTRGAHAVYPIDPARRIRNKGSHVGEVVQATGAEAESRFRLYLAEAMTENGENWNWFGRPTHTEPCAVVDSRYGRQRLFEGGEG